MNYFMKVSDKCEEVTMKTEKYKNSLKQINDTRTMYKLFNKVAMTMCFLFDFLVHLSVISLEIHLQFQKGI